MITKYILIINLALCLTIGSSCVSQSDKTNTFSRDTSGSESSSNSNTVKQDDYHGVAFSLDQAGPSKPASVETWLDSHTTIRDAIRLEATSSSNLISNTLVENQYVSWSAADKAALESAFTSEWNWLYRYSNYLSNYGIDQFSMPLYCSECIDDLTSTPNSFPMVILTDDELSKKVYISFVAHTLAVEIGNKVSWSITSLSTANLHHLLNSRSVMQRYGSVGYLFGQPTFQVNDRSKYLGNITPSTPRYAQAFLQKNSLVKSTHLATITALMEWARDNMVHYYYASTYKNMYDHWQYPTQPPVNRVIDGTTSPYYPYFGHWTAGCHGTAGFFKQVLRVVNIPVENILTCGHAILYFPTIGKYLDHGDDPYNQNVKDKASSKDIVNLLITPTTFQSYFGTSPDFLSTSNSYCNNIGRTAREF